MTIAKRVRDCRYAKGWGPDELAHRATISRTALYQIECGKTETPRASTLRRIAQALDVSVEALLGKEELRLTVPLAMLPPVGSTFAENSPGADAPTEGDLNSFRRRPLRLHPSREVDVHKRLQELLESEFADHVSRIVEELHHMLAINSAPLEG
jgi:transcriptional regulator with XRE-family HTH domain